MECLPVEKVPEGHIWTYELKLDGYRMEAVKTNGKVALYSRRSTDLTKRFPYVAADLAGLPDDTVIDGELVALDEEGRPSFNLLQNSAQRHHTSCITPSTFSCKAKAQCNCRFRSVVPFSREH
jgi:bifunctional non-homologous end joining protein LigD